MLIKFFRPLGLLLSLLGYSPSFYAETLTWSSNKETNIVEYKIYIIVNNKTNSVTVGKNTTNYHFAATLNTDYSIRIAAQNDLFLEGDSIPILYTTPPAPVKITDASILKLETNTWISATLKWQKVNNITNYLVNLERSGVLTQSNWVGGQAFTFQSLPIDDYKIYVTITNKGGFSGVNSYWSLSKARPGLVNDKNIINK